MEGLEILLSTRCGPPARNVGFGRYSGLKYPVPHAGDRAPGYFHAGRSIGRGLGLFGSLDWDLAQVEAPRTCSNFGSPFNVSSGRCLAGR